jgi:hypothetical protein
MRRATEIVDFRITARGTSVPSQAASHSLRGTASAPLDRATMDEAEVLAELVLRLLERIRPEPCSEGEWRKDQRDVLIYLSRAPAQCVVALSVALAPVAFCCTEGDALSPGVEAIPGREA